MGTTMKVNRSVTSAGSGLALTYLELESLIQVPAQATIYVPIVASYHRYEVKTVLVKSTAPSTLGIRIDDRDTNGDKCYESLNEATIYNIVNVPVTDKTGQKKIHAFVSNTGTSSVDVRIVIKLIPFEGGI